MKKNEVVSLIKCTNSKLIGVVYEETEVKNNWIIKWCFPINEVKAGREGYGEQMITGEYEFGVDYPGCPYCGCVGYFLCNECGKLNCWDGDRQTVTCGWCGTTAQIGGGPIRDIRAGGNM